MKHVKKRGNVYYYRRAVPTDLREAIGRNEFVVSLKTTNELEAIDLYSKVHSQCEALFRSYRSDPLKAQKDYLKSLKEIASSIGRTYASAASKSKLSDADSLSDFEDLAKEWVRLGKPTDKRFSALFGEVDDKPKFSDAYDFFIEHNAFKKTTMSKREYSKWEKPRTLWKNEFIKVQGDLPIDEITAKVTYAFKQHLQSRISNGEIAESTAAKCGTYLRTIFACRNEELQLGLLNPFSTLKFSKAGGKRKTIRKKQIRDVLLRDGYLDGLNDQARAILLVMINTGCGPKELCGLLPEEILLDKKIPRIVIQENSIRKLKTGNRNRTIPLVGVSLDAMKLFPEGFDRYRYDTGPDSLSQCLNKYLKEHNYFEKGQTLYSHRHAFKDRMRNANFPSELMDELMGHSSKTTGQKYGKGYSNKRKQVELHKISI